MTNPEGCGIADLGGGKFLPLQFEHSQIGARVTPGQRGGNCAAIWQAEAQVFVAFERMVCGDDHPLSPLYSARGYARAAMYGNDGLARTRDRLS